MDDVDKTAGLLKSAKARTTLKLAALQTLMDHLSQQVMAGEYDEAYAQEGEKSVPSASRLCIDAGVGRYFLYGPTHKYTTANEVEAFRKNLISELESRAGSPDRDTRRLASDELARLRGEHQKLRDYAHIWHQRMRSMRRELRALKEMRPPKVVSLNEAARKR